jgi:nucleoside-diphosphate-sugar epimerase
MQAIPRDLTGEQVLVTGGTGFIGGRLVERLVLECRAQVRVLVRNFSHAARIARFPIEMIPGDVTVPSDVERAVRGCQFVFHCAYGNQNIRSVQHRVDVEGTTQVCEAARQAGVKRVVHLSSVTVYGLCPDGDLDETAPRRPLPGIYYSETKLQAEQIALEYYRHHRLPVVVLQLVAVYGPFSPIWTVKVLRQLQTGRVILVNGGEGLFNAVYVDDAVNAILLAAVRDEAVGEAILIAGKEPLTQRKFYQEFERMLGRSSTVSMTMAEAVAYHAKRQPELKSILRASLNLLREEPLIRECLMQTREVDALRRFLKPVVPTPIWQSLRRRVKGQGNTVPAVRPSSDGGAAIHPLHPSMARLFAAKTRVRIDKARRLLGYQPTFDGEAGFALTQQWAAWANLLYASGGGRETEQSDLITVADVDEGRESMAMRAMHG